METEKSIGRLTVDLKTEVKEFIETNAELFKLEIIEKTSIAGSFLIYGLIFANIALLALLFAFMALGFLLGKWLENMAAGFLIISLLYSLIAIVLIIFRKTVFSGFQNSFLKVLDPSLEKEEKV
jgi:hypothetical protein